MYNKRPLLYALLPMLLQAAGPSYEVIDRHAMNTPSHAESSVEMLAQYLIRPAQNDREKIRAIFRWITANITYDTRAYFVGSPHAAGSGDVLKNRTAVCDGYSTLFEGLGKAAGLNIVKISGYAKGYRYQIGDHFEGQPNHAWNAVWIDQHWELLDATWGSGYIDESGKFIHEFDEHFFFTDPGDMIYTHFPAEEKWQLIDPPVNQEAFESLPFLKPAYFHNKIRMKSHTQGLISCDDNLMVVLDNPEEAQIIARLIKNNETQKDRYTLVQYQRNTAQVRVTFPDKGSYTLRIFAKPKNTGGAYLWAMDYQVQVKTRRGENSERFPEIFQPFNEYKVCIISPLTNPLKKSTDIEFNLSVPGAVEVLIIQGKHWEPMERQDDNFIKTTKVMSGELQIGARFSETRQFDILLQYKVE